MRRFATFATFLLFACAAEEPPPGNVIGTYDFVATLEAEGACFLEEVAEIPNSLSFSAILSHDPQSGKLWFRSGATEQAGEISGTTFTLRTPSDGGGIPRTFNACTLERRQPCPFMVTEIIEAEILAECPDELGEPTGGEPLPCPDLHEDGTPLWHNCACVRGRLEELLRFDPVGEEVCTCVGAATSEAFEGSCRLGYRLEGEKR